MAIAVDEDQNQAAEVKPRYRWPWFLLALVLLGLVLTVLTVRHEVQRLRWQRETTMPEAAPTPVPSSPTNTTQ